MTCFLEQRHEVLDNLAILGTVYLCYKLSRTTPQETKLQSTLL